MRLSDPNDPPRRRRRKKRRVKPPPLLPRTKEIMEEKAEEEAKPEEPKPSAADPMPAEPKPEPAPEPPVAPYKKPTEPITLAETIEIKEAKEEIIERKPNVFPLEPPQPPPAPTESAEVQLLRAKLEAAELRAQLAEARAGQKAPISEVVAKPLPGTHPMPKPEEIPTGAPPIPALDPLMGDKTPAVIEWFKQHWPEEHERRYAGRLRKKGPEEEEGEEEYGPASKKKEFEPAAAGPAGVDLRARQY